MITAEPWQGKPAVGAERPITASHGQGNQGRVKAPEHWDWDDLVQFVQRPGESDVTHSYYFSLPKNGDDSQSELKKRDPFILFGECRDGVRDDRHLLGRSAVTLDFDQRDALKLMRKLRLEAIPVPFAYLWHTTRSHDLNLVADRVQPKLRIIVPLTRDVGVAEYWILARNLSKFFPATVDEAAFKPSQMMYCPIHNREAKYSRGVFEGQGYLDPDSVLAMAVDDPQIKDSENRRQLAKRGYDAMINAEPPLKGIDADAARDYLERLDSDERDLWLQVGRALHHQFSGREEGLDLWDEWSQGSSKYQAGEPAIKWAEMRVSPDRKPTTFRTILKLAGEADEQESVRLLARFVDEIDNAQPLDRKRLEEGIPKEIGRESALSPLLRKALCVQLQKRQRALFGAALTTKELLDRMTAAPVAVKQGGSGADDRYTEMGNARRLYDRLGHNLIFIPELQVWYRWQHGHWAEYPVEAIRRTAQQVVTDMPHEIPDDMSGAQVVDYMAWCIKSQTKHMIDAMISLLSGVPGSNMIVPGAMLDSNAHLLGVRNGALDLTTGELREAARDDLITHVTACDYDAGALCPLFEKVVSDAFYGDEAMIEWFQRVLGYSLLGNPKEQFFVIPYGNGSNGKSTILNAVRDVLGAYATSTPYTTFLTDGRGQASASGPTEHLLRLKGKRFVYMSEPESGLQIRTSLVKSVTGGDALQARGVHARKSVEFKPTWVIFMPTNHKPIVPDEDHGIWRRMKLVPFDRNFDADREIEKDTGLEEKLKDEYAGILAWCVAGATKYQRAGLGDEPRKVSDAHDEYKSSMDVLADWLEDCWTVTGDFTDKVTAMELWASWERYAQRTGTLYLCNSSKSLGRRMANRKFRTWRSKNGRGFSGLIRRDRGADEQGFGD